MSFASGTIADPVDKEITENSIDERLAVLSIIMVTSNKESPWVERILTWPQGGTWICTGRSSEKKTQSVLPKIECLWWLSSKSNNFLKPKSSTREIVNLKADRDAIPEKGEILISCPSEIASTLITEPVPNSKTTLLMHMIELGAAESTCFKTGHRQIKPYDDIFREPNFVYAISTTSSSGW